MPVLDDDFWDSIPDATPADLTRDDEPVTPPKAETPQAQDRPANHDGPDLGDDFWASIPDANPILGKDMVSGDPKRAAKAYAISKREGLAESEAEINLDQLEASSRAREADTYLLGASSTRKWASERPEGGKAIADVLPQVKEAEDALKDNVEGFGNDFNLARQMTALDFEISSIWADHIDDGSRLTPEEQERVTKLEADKAVLASKMGNESGFGAASGQLLGSMIYAPQYGAEGAAEGAAMAGLYGVSRALAVGAGALASTGVGAPAAVGAGAIANMALIGATAESTYRLESGSAYQGAIEAGVDPSVARDTAGVVGFVNAGLELFSVATGIKLIGRPVVDGIKREVSRRIFKSATERAIAEGLKKRTMAGAIKGAAKAYGGAVAAETTTEVLQEVVGVIGDEINARLSGTKGQTPDEIAQRITDTLVTTAKGMMVLGGLGGLGVLGSNVRLVRQAQRDSDTIERVAKAVQAASTDPDKAVAVADVVQAQAEDAGKPTVFVEAERFEQAMAEANVSVTDVAQAVPGVTEASIAQAKAAGGDVEIPTAIYAQKIVGTQLGDALRADVRLTRDGLSAREAESARAQSRQLILDASQGKIDEAKLDKAVAGIKDPGIKKAYRQLAEDYEKTLTEAQASTRMTRDEIKRQAKYGAWLVANLAQRAHIPASRVMALAPRLVFRRTDNPQAEVVSPEAIENNPTTSQGETQGGVAYNMPITQGREWHMGPANVSADRTLSMERIENKQEPLESVVESFEKIFSKGVKNEDTGFVLTASSSDIKKWTAHPRRRWFLQTVGNRLIDLTKGAILIESHADTMHKNSDVQGIHRLVNAIQIGNQHLRVILTVRDYATKGQERAALHSVDNIDFEILDKESPSASKAPVTDGQVVGATVSPSGEVQPPVVPQPFKVSLSQVLGGSKPYVRADGKGPFDPVDESSRQEGGVYFEEASPRTESGDYPQSIINRNRRSEYANPEAEEHAKYAEELRQEEPRDYRPEFTEKTGDSRKAKLSAQSRAVQWARVHKAAYRSGRATAGSVRVSVVSAWKADSELERIFHLNGIDTPTIYELDHSKESAETFSRAISEAKDGNAFGAAVYVYPVKEYQKMRLFLIENGKAGIAVKENGDIVSLFNNKGGQSVAHSLLQVATESGGTHLDCFDTMLPPLYSAHGLRVITRQRWNDRYIPDGWNKETFAGYNHGEPDVTYMVYDPTYYGVYHPEDGIVESVYDNAVRGQMEAVRRISRPAEEDLIHDVNELLQTAYHGSPYRFTEFSVEHIGEGEGNQAHGWGLYFALNRETAEGYRSRLSEIVLYDGEPINKLPKAVQNEIDNLLFSMGGFLDKELLIRMQKDRIDRAEEAIVYERGYITQLNRVKTQLQGWDLSNERELLGRIPSNISLDVMDAYGEALHRAGMDYQKIKSSDFEKALQGKIDKENEKLALAEKDLEIKRGYDASKVSKNRVSGTIYEVEIPDDDVLLNEQLPLKNQFPKVKEAIRKVWRSLALQDQLNLAQIVYPQGWQASERETRLRTERDDILSAIGAFERIWDTTQMPFRIRGAERALKAVGYSDKEIQSFKTSKEKAEAEAAVYEEANEAKLDEIDNELASERAKRDAREKELLARFEDKLVDSPIISGEGFYNALAGVLHGEYVYGKSPKNASLALNAAGIKGIRYDGQRDGPCAVIFDDQAIQITEYLERLKSGQGNAGYRGSFNPSLNRVTLTESADLSTFSHEMGHWYLESILALSQDASVSQSVKDDASTILKEFGLNSIQDWNALTREQREMRHEAFAGWVEIYLAEGRAPTKRTEGFFKRFGQWIRGVYRMWAGGADEAVKARYREQFGAEMPELSDEVRRVLDRMVASEEDIERAEEINGMAPLFETKPEGMADDEWEEMSREKEDAFDSGTEALAKRRAKDEKWYTNARSSLLRKKMFAARRIRKAIRDEVEERVSSRPDYRALELMKAGDHANVVPNCKLSEESLRAMGLNINQIGKLRGMGVVAVKGGITPENARELLRPFARFNSGKQLVQALLNLEDRESLIERLTTERCLKEHSEMFDEKKLDEAVTQALHADARSRLLAHELAWLNNDKPSRTRVYQAAVKLAAQELINKEKVTEATPAQHLALEARWGRIANNALKKGDRIGALRAKRMQAIHHEAVKLAYEVQQIQRSIKDMSKRAFGSNKDMGKRYGMPLIHAIRFLMLAKGIRNPKKGETTISNALKEIEKFEKYDPDAFAIVKAAINRWGNTSPRLADMNVEDVRAFQEDIKLLFKLARDAGQIRNGNKAIAVEEAVDDLVNRHQKAYPKGAPAPIGANRSVTDSEAAGFHLMHAKTWVMRVENWCRAMDGGANGPFMRLIFNPVEKALTAWRLANVDYQKRFLALLEPMREKWASVKDIEAREIGYTFTTKEELISALLHTGNASNKRKLLMGGRGKDNPWCRVIERTNPDTGKVEYLMDSSQWDAFIDRCFRDGIITKEDMDFVQGVWDLLEDTKTLTQKAFYRIYGDYFEEVEATPIATPFGVYRGGYVPAKTSPILDTERQEHDDLDSILKTNAAVSAMPFTQPGFSITRVEYNKPLDLDMAGLSMHISEVLKFAYAAPACLDVFKILRDERFSAEIDAQNPHIVKKLLIPWLKRAYTQTIYSENIGEIGQYLKQLRGIAGMGIMAGHIVNALQQLTGFSVALKDIRVKDLRHGFRIFYGDRKGAMERIAALSPFMKTRLDNYAFGYQQRIEQITSTKDGVRQANGLFNKVLAADRKLDATRDWVGRHAYFLQTGIQAPIDAIVWTGAYSKALEDGMDSEAAVLRADSVVRTSQSSFNPEDIGNVETGNPFSRLFLVFYNYFGMQLNALAESYTRNKASLDDGTKSWLKAYGDFSFDAIAVLWIPSVVAAFLAQAFAGFEDDGDDDEWGAYELMRLFIAEPLKNVIAMIPYGGSMVNSFGTSLAKNKVGWAQFVWGSDPFEAKPLGSPAVDVIINAIQFVSDLVGDKDIKARTATRNFLDLAAMITRLPLGALKKPLGYTAQYFSEGVSDDSAIGILRGLINGREPKNY